MAAEQPQPELPTHALEEIFRRVPAADQCLAVALLSKAWRAWSGRRPEGVRAQCREGAKPLWYLQAVYGRLSIGQQVAVGKWAAIKAAEAGDLATVKFVHTAGDCLYVP